MDLEGYSGIIECRENIVADQAESIRQAYDIFQSMFDDRDADHVEKCSEMNFNVRRDVRERDLPYLNAVIEFPINLLALPFSCLDTYTAWMIPSLPTADLVGLNHIFDAFRGNGFKVKCGPAAKRRVYKFEDLVFANILKRIDVACPEINFKDIEIIELACSKCLNNCHSAIVKCAC